MNQSAHDAAKQRVAFVFRRSPAQINRSDRFDVELKAGRASDFRANEFDLLSDDIQQMRSAQELSNSKDVTTVGEYCDLADRYSRADPKGWVSLLAEWEKEERLSSAPHWRRAIWRLVGI